MTCDLTLNQREILRKVAHSGSIGIPMSDVPNTKFNEYLKLRVKGWLRLKAAPLPHRWVANLKTLEGMLK